MSPSEVFQFGLYFKITQKRVEIEISYNLIKFLMGRGFFMKKLFTVFIFILTFIFTSNVAFAMNVNNQIKTIKITVTCISK